MPGIYVKNCLINHFKPNQMNATKSTRLSKPLFTQYEVFVIAMLAFLETVWLLPLDLINAGYLCEEFTD
jgi:hypothetical protein